MGGDKTQTTTTDTTQQLQAFGPAQQPLEQIVQQAGALQGVGTAQPSTPFFQTGVDQLSQLIQSGGAVSDPAAQFGAQLFGAAPTGTEALQQIAGSQFGVSPEFQQVLEARLGNVGARAARQNQAFGRAGSPAAGAAIAGQLGDVSAQALLGESQRQSAQRLAAAQALQTGGLQGFGQLPSIFSAESQGGNRALQLDALLRGEGQRQVLEPLQNLQAQAGVISPIGATFGTQTGQQVATQVTPSNPFAQALGLGLTGASLFVPGAGGISAAGNLFGGRGFV